MDSLGILDRAFKLIYPDTSYKNRDVYSFPHEKVVEAFRREYPDAFLVGYKAEALLDREELLRRAYKRLTEVGMDLIVANDLKDVGEERNIVLLITPGKDAFEVDGRKEEIARFIMDKSLEIIGE